MLERTQVEIARKQIEFARGYTLSLVEDLAQQDWFRQPAGCPTHVAWQVGHLAMAEYGLALFRQRGRRPEDNRLMSARFRKQFSKGSIPDPANDPPREEILAVLDRVHRQVLEELDGYTDQELEAPVPEPHAVVATRLGALFFCAQHEMLHAGQLGLLRRLLGKASLR